MFESLKSLGATRAHKTNENENENDTQVASHSV